MRFSHALLSLALPWFGVALPTGLGDPHRPILDVQAIHSGPMYHTSGDTLDTISTPGLERAARFYAFLVSEIVKAERTSLQPH